MANPGVFFRGRGVSRLVAGKAGRRRKWKGDFSRALLFRSLLVGRSGANRPEVRFGAGRRSIQEETVGVVQEGGRMGHGEEKLQKSFDISLQGEREIITPTSWESGLRASTDIGRRKKLGKEERKMEPLKRG